MSRQRVALVLSLATLATPASALAADPGGASPKLTLSPAMPSLGQPVELKLQGKPGSFVCLLTDPDCWPFFVPGLGEVGIGLSPSLVLLTLPSIPADGCLTLSQTFDCAVPLLGVPLCMQAVLVEPGALEFVISNPVELLLQDAKGFCGSGCTSKFWKKSKNAGDFPPPYTPDTLFADVFDDVFPEKTFEDVLKKGGGGLMALGRHSVAALLNAASGMLELTPEEVIDLFNATAGGTEEEIEALADFFEGLNEAGCPFD